MQGDNATGQLPCQQLDGMCARAMARVELADAGGLDGVCNVNDLLVACMNQVKSAHVCGNGAPGKSRPHFAHDDRQPCMRAAIEDGQRCVWGGAELEHERELVGKAVGDKDVPLPQKHAGLASYLPQDRGRVRHEIRARRAGGARWG